MRPASIEAYQLMHDGTKALAQVEENGVCIDVDYLNSTIIDLEQQIKNISTELKEDPIYHTWRKKYGIKTTLGNKQQLASIVFDELGFKSKGEKTSKGHKADEAAFDHVDLYFVRKYIHLEKIKKATNTYLKGWQREMVDGFIHPFYNSHIAVTYRLTCDTPNFQNIPTRLEMMREITRRAFVSRFGKKGHVVEFDFKGIEVGVSVCYHFDPNLKSYVEDKKRDMHRDTAMELFFLKQDVVHKDVRHIAKNKFVFPQFYGDWYAQCARNIWEELRKTKAKVSGTETTIFKHLRAHGINELGDWDPNNREGKYEPRPGTFEHHCKQVQDSFWNDRFPVYTAWKNQTWEDYQRKGYVRFHTGFVAQGIFEKNKVLNYQIQGSASHCALWCLIQMQKWLTKNDMRSKIIGTIHDSELMDIHTNELDAVIDQLHHIMSVELPKHWPWIIVPLEVEIDVSPPGGSWLDKGKFVKTGTEWSLKA